MATDLLNIRSDPSTSGNILQTATTGETFTVVGQSDDGQWLQLAKDGTTVGWAAAEFLTVEERVSPGAGRPAAVPVTLVAAPAAVPLWPPAPCCLPR